MGVVINILVKTVDEFAGMDPKDIVSYIEGEPFHLVKDSIVNSHAWKGKMDLINIVMIGLAEKLPEHEEKYELHRLLGELLSQDLTINEKLDIIGNEHAIPMEKDFRKDVSIMCNLSQKIKETGIEMGKREMIMKMHSKGYTTAQIADVAEVDVKQIEDIIKLEFQSAR